MVSPGIHRASLSPTGARFCPSVVAHPLVRKGKRRRLEASGELLEAGP